MTGLGTERTPASTSHLPPAPREAADASDVWVSLSIALVLGLIATAIALWPAEPHAKTAAQSQAPTLATKDPVSGSPAPIGPPEAQNSPTRFANPFDTSEVFEFPPGTPEDAAKEFVAETLLQRAREREAHITSVKHGRGHPSARLRPATLMSESIYKKAT